MSGDSKQHAEEADHAPEAMEARKQPLDKRERVEPPPRPQIPLVLWILLAFLLGAALMFVRMNHLYLDAQEVSRGFQTMSVRARADPRESQFGASGEVVVLDGDFQGKRLELRYGNDSVPLELGQRAEIRGVVEAIPLEAKQLHRFKRGLSSVVSVQAVSDVHYGNDPLGQLWQLRATLQEALRERASTRAGQQHESEEKDEAYGLIAGLTYGDRRELKDTVLEGALQRTGLAHFLAVSGTHLALLGAVLFFILRKTSLNRICTGVITLFVCTSFVFFTGFAAGSIRSILMLALAFAAYFLHRRVCVLSSLGFAGLGMLIIDPLLAVSLGFLLSFGSVLAIVIFGRYIQQWLTCCLVPVRLRHRSKAFTNGLAIALVASIATLPLTMDAFGILPLIGPLANLFLAPALCALLVLSFIAHFALLIAPALSTVFLDICLAYSELLGTIIRSLASISWASIPTDGFSPVAICLFLTAIVALWLWWPKPDRQTALQVSTALLCVLVISGSFFSVYSYVSTDLLGQGGSDKVVIILDVGQGDAMLVQDGDQTILIDAGPSPALLRQRLLENSVRKIDVLVFTHDHADHARGAQTLDASYGIKEIIVAEGAQSSPVFRDISQRVNAPLVGVLAGDYLAMSRLEVRFIWPLASVKDPSANESCLIKVIVDLAPDDKDSNPLDIVLTSGDAEAPEVKRALRQPTGLTALDVNGTRQEVDVLKVPHHGSKNSLDEQLGRMIAEGEGLNSDDNTSVTRKNGSKTAVISVGKDNSYGHPRAEPLEVIERYFQKLYRTDQHGSVTIEL